MCHSMTLNSLYLTWHSQLEVFRPCYYYYYHPLYWVAPVADTELLRSHGKFLNTSKFGFEFSAQGLLPDRVLFITWQYLLLYLFQVENISWMSNWKVFLLELRLSCGEHSSHASEHKLKSTNRKQLNSQSKVLINGAFMTSCQNPLPKFRPFIQTD